MGQRMTSQCRGHGGSGDGVTSPHGSLIGAGDGLALDGPEVTTGDRMTSRHGGHDEKPCKEGTAEQCDYPGGSWDGVM
ncbi:unnamed protein product [Caretta caretta]